MVNIYKDVNGWWIEIRKDGKIQTIGSFPTREKARSAWKTEKVNIFPERPKNPASTNLYDMN